MVGEASGDLHAANLVKQLNQNKDFNIIGMGGQYLQDAGVTIKHDYRKVNFMGFVDVFKNLRTILKKLSEVKQDVLKEKPTAVLLVDYPGFNLRLAKFCKENQIKVIYYISPQIWAWKQSRVELIRKYVDKMITILPFEKEFYKKFNVDVEYVGHPLLDAIQQHQYNTDFISTLNHKAKGKKIIALLPGSRKAEIIAKLPLMLELAKRHDNDYYFVIAAAPNSNRELYNRVPLDIYYGETYNILKTAFAAIVTSGTATLETALHKVPQVVCYKTSFINYEIGKRVARVNYISLVNLILNKPSVTELIQHSLTIENLEAAFIKITSTDRSRILNDYETLIHLLEDSGASARASCIIKTYLL